MYSYFRNDLPKTKKKEIKWEEQSINIIAKIVIIYSLSKGGVGMSNVLVVKAGMLYGKPVL